MVVVVEYDIDHLQFTGHTMPSLVYLHGFLSSPLSIKAQTTNAWLKEHHPDWQFHCPSLPSSPALTKQAVDECFSQLDPRQTGVIGSSMGGFWATYICERYAIPTVLINPAVSPHVRFRHLVGTSMKNYYTTEICTLQDTDNEVLEACDQTTIRDADLYWLLVQTKDEVLDYRLAVERYRGVQQAVEEGGSHAFDGYEARLPDIIEFIQRRL